jgi:hypothetical protein
MTNILRLLAAYPEVVDMIRRQEAANRSARTIAITRRPTPPLMQSYPAEIVQLKSTMLKESNHDHQRSRSFGSI